MDTWGIQHPVMGVQQGGPEDQRREDSQNVLLAVPGKGDTSRGVVRVMDDGSGAFLPGEAYFWGKVLGVRGGGGSQVAVSPSTDAAW